MRLISAAVVVALVGMCAPALDAQEIRLPPHEVAGALAPVLGMRGSIVPDSAVMDACSLVDALAGDTAWVAHLPASLAADLRAGLSGGCGPERPRARVLVRFRDLDVETAGRVVVRATRVSPGLVFHERYEVRKAPSRPGASRWELDSVELSDFAHVLSPPPPPAPPGG